MDCSRRARRPKQPISNRLERYKPIKSNSPGPNGSINLSRKYQVSFVDFRDWTLHKETESKESLSPGQRRDNNSHAEYRETQNEAKIDIATQSGTPRKP